MSLFRADKITGRTGSSDNAPITLSGDTATLSGTGVTFPAGHIISFATGTLTRTSDLTISDGDFHLTDLSCDLVTTSTSNKIVVQYFIPDVYQLESTGNSIHLGVRYNVGTGAFDNSAAQTLGDRPYVTAYENYFDNISDVPANIRSSHIMVTATVPTVNTLRLYPILKGYGGGVHIFDNASNSDFDEASIIAYEIKQ